MYIEDIINKIKFGFGGILLKNLVTVILIYKINYF